MAFFTLRGKRQTTFGRPLVAEWRAVSVRVKPHPDGARRAVSMATQLVPWTAQQNVRVCRVVYRRANTDMGQSVLVGGGGLVGGRGCSKTPPCGSYCKIYQGHHCMGKTENYHQQILGKLSPKKSLSGKTQ